MVVDNLQRDLQVRQDHPVRMVSQEKLESLEILDKMLHLPRHHLKWSHVKHVNRHRMVTQALKDHQVHLEVQERTGLPVKEENQVLKGRLDRQDLMDILENLANLVSPEHLDHSTKERLSKDLLVHLERTANLDWKVIQEYQEMLESLEDKDRLVIKDRMDRLEILELQAIKVLLGIMDPKVDVIIVRHPEQLLDIDGSNTAINFRFYELLFLYI